MRLPDCHAAAAYAVAQRVAAALRIVLGEGPKRAVGGPSLALGDDVRDFVAEAVSDKACDLICIDGAETATVQDIGHRSARTVANGPPV